ncbi:MAG: toxin-antitoxin system protein [Selenomonadaceae bacterium]|nr:toxin-antitoxin system protein [Selenomonadaceae bacterium]
MTPLRQEAFQLLASIPEESLFSVIQYLQAEKLSQLSREQRIKEKKIALDELLQFSKPIPELDDEKELAQYREEKFGNAHIN